jgi:hypothetical protein
MAQFRAAARARANCLSSGACSLSDPVLFNASRWLLKPPEHTWGLPSVADAGADSSWSNANFSMDGQRPAYQRCAQSWNEQRTFNEWTVQTLEAGGSGDTHRLAAAIRREWAELIPSVPDPESAGYSRVPSIAPPMTCGDVQIGFDFGTGAITSLVQLSTGVVWASQTAPLGRLVYTTWNESGYDPNAHVCDQVLGGKPGSDSAGPLTRDWETSLQSLWVLADDDAAEADTGGAATPTVTSCRFWAQLALDPVTVSDYGGFETAWLSVNISTDNNMATVLDMDLRWFNKTAYGGSSRPVPGLSIPVWED